jgi:hypothetical protein
VNSTMDGKKYEAGKFAFTLRKRLFLWVVMLEWDTLRWRRLI